MSERDVLNGALSEYHVNMNIVTPLIDQVVADEGGGSTSDILTVHVIGGDVYTADTPVATVWEKINAGGAVIVEFKETTSSSAIKKYYPIEMAATGEDFEKMTAFVNPLEEEYIICMITTNPQPPHDEWIKEGE